jgi:hypothetical protein
MSIIREGWVLLPAILCCQSAKQMLLHSVMGAFHGEVKRIFQIHCQSSYVDLWDILLYIE